MVYPKVKAYTIFDKSPIEENLRTPLNVLKKMKKTILKKRRVGKTTNNSFNGISTAAWLFHSNSIVKTENANISISINRTKTRGRTLLANFFFRSFIKSKF